jgi:Xaa-Pro aminopeptidase
MGPGSVAILVGARLATRSADTEYPFRQDSDFWYLTGFEHPHAVAVLRTDGGPGFTLFVQPKEPAAETWTGYRPGVEGAKRDYGADESHPVDSLKGELPGLIQQVERLHHVLGRDTVLDAQILEVIENLRRQSRLGMAPPSLIVDPREILHEMRLHKEAAEIDLMRRAAAISAEAHAEAARIAQPGRYEYELEAVLNYTFRRRGGAGPAYGTIVGGGANAATLHYIANNQVLRQGEMVLIDAGVEYDGYASDVTRTYPIGGTLNGPGREIYQAVLASQEAGLAACKPGATLDGIHDVTLRALVEGMVALKMIPGPVDEAIEKQTYQPYYMHRTSHWLGLDVHDVGAYSTGGKPRVLEPGMTFTVEPGLYIARDAEDPAVKGFRGIGVRIEDDVVITADGHENLNTAIPKNPDEVEAWVQGS